MAVLSLHPSLTLGNHELAERFYHTFHSEVELYVDAPSLKTEGVLARLDATGNDVVVFFNRADMQCRPIVERFLENAEKNGASLIPVAISDAHRTPPVPAKRFQSLDVVEELRRRSLTLEQIETVATSLARSVVARVQPTLVTDHMHLFLSYRRKDGEALAASLYAQFRLRSETVFRDLVDIRTGEDAMQTLDANLQSCDAVIFLDTPKAGESQWIVHELETAMALNLPLIWVKVESAEERTPLRVTPHVESPHFTLKAEDQQVTLTNDLADMIIKKAFEMTVESGQRIFEFLSRFRALAREFGFAMKELDHRSMLYAVEIPRVGFRYRQRPMVHLVQIYGRRPKEEDIERFKAHIARPNQRRDQDDIDAGLILGPIPTQTWGDSSPCFPLIDSCDEYVASIMQFVIGQAKAKAQGRRGIIISGSFPDADAQYQHRLIDALHAFAKGILDRSGTIIFGGHPSFVHTLASLAKLRRPTDTTAALHLYLSRLLTTDEAIAEYRAYASVFPVDAVHKEKHPSLTAMRKRMIDDNQAVALVAMGGKTHSGGHHPGVDEEIELARAAGLPVYLIGSTGGRTAEIAAVLSSDGWRKKWNDLSAAENEELMVNPDFGYLCDRILAQLGF